MISRNNDATRSPANDVPLAVQSSKRLRELAAEEIRGLRLQIGLDNGKKRSIQLPLSVLSLVTKILDDMASGTPVAIQALETELTTNKAAQFLNVSRPFLIDQMEKGIIPFRKVGSHRRVLVKDLIDYKESMHQKRRQSLEELSALDQELNFGY